MKEKRSDKFSDELYPASHQTDIPFSYKRRDQIENESVSAVRKRVNAKTANVKKVRKAKIEEQKADLYSRAQQEELMNTRP